MGDTSPAGPCGSLCESLCKQPLLAQMWPDAVETTVTENWAGFYLLRFDKKAPLGKLFPRPSDGWRARLEGVPGATRHLFSVTSHSGVMNWTFGLRFIFTGSKLADGACRRCWKQRWRAARGDRGPDLTFPASGQMQCTARGLASARAQKAPHHSARHNDTALYCICKCPRRLLVKRGSANKHRTNNYLGSER